ncbi:hypothetical protein D3C85_1562410 [compost metagenome]
MACDKLNACTGLNQGVQKVVASVLWPERCVTSARNILQEKIKFMPRQRYCIVPCLCLRVFDNL